jgi:hypothetical protein
MTRAAWVQLLVGLAGGIAALLAFFNIAQPGVGIPVAIFISIVSSAIAGRLFRMIASPDEQRRELEDRVRNPD